MSAVLHLRAASMLREAWSTMPPAERPQAITARPLLGAIETECEDLRLEFLLRAERLVWEAVNRHRYAIYQDAWKAWYRRWQKAADWPWPVSEPFVAQHERIMAAARDYELPMTPLTDGVRRDVYAKGLADAAILANVEMDWLEAIAPPIEEVLP
jgi:hypothetical protein